MIHRYSPYFWTICIVVFSIVSFTTSYTGLIELFSIEARWLNIGFAIIVFFLQGILVFSLHYILVGGGSLSMKFIALIMYLFVSFLSIDLSFGFYAKHLTAKEYAQNSLELIMNNVIMRLNEAQNKFNLVLENLQKMEEYSIKKEQEEITYGGTCDSRVPKGIGYFTQLRRDDSLTAKLHTQELKNIVSEFNQKIESLRKRVKAFYISNNNIKKFEKDINKEIIALNSLYLKHVLLTEIKESVAQRSGQARHHLLTHYPEDGKKKVKQPAKLMSCEDAFFTARAFRLIKAIDSVKLIESITFFDKDDTREVLRRNLDVLYALVHWSSIKEVRKTPSDVVINDFVPLLLGTIIDMFILTISLLQTKGQRLNSFDIEEIKKKLTDPEIKKLMTSLSLFTTEHYWHYFVTIPIEEDGSLFQAKEIIKLMQQAKIGVLHVPKIDRSEFKHTVKPELLKRYPNASFSVHKLKKRAFLQWHQNLLSM